MCSWPAAGSPVWSGIRVNGRGGIPPRQIRHSGRYLVWLLLAATLGLPQPSPADALPSHHPVPGGIAIVPLGPLAANELNARFGRTPIMTLKDDKDWVGVVGIDLGTAVGNYLITVTTAAGETIARKFFVTAHNYPFDPKTVQAQIPEGVEIPAEWSPEMHAILPLVWPARAKRSGTFGTRYAKNGEVGSVSWAVLSLSENTDVSAPGAGIISKIDEYGEGQFYISIEHGMGLYSTIGPVLKIRGKTGEKVDKGDVLGTFDVDTSPSGILHWRTSLNKVSVNPVLLVSQPPNQAGTAATGQE